jgi:hypothetical protein
MTKLAFSKEIIYTSIVDYNLRRNYCNDTFVAQLYTVLNVVLLKGGEDRFDRLCGK